MAKKFNIDKKDSPKLSLPGKLVVPSYKRSGNFSILGLGDIVIPGLLLCFVLRFDAYKRNMLSQVIISSDVCREHTNDNESKKCRLSKSEDCSPSYKHQQPHKTDCECLNCKKNNNRTNVFLKPESSNLRYFSYPIFLGSSNYSSLSHSTQHSYSIRNLIGFHQLSYFHCSLIGYFVGLIAATLSSEIFREAQPALLYLVPFTLLPLLTMAYFKVNIKF